MYPLFQSLDRPGLVWTMVSDNVRTYGTRTHGDEMQLCL